MDERMTLKKRIHAVDFALLETGLFLDTHPCNGAALAQRDEYRRMRQALIETYEAQYGPYVVTAADVPCGDRYAWVDGPWPWEGV